MTSGRCQGVTELSAARLLIALVLVFYTSGLYATPAGEDAIKQANSHLARLKTGPSAKDVFDIANSIGPAIDAVRSSEVTDAQLKTLQGLLEQMRRVTEQKLASIEAESQENEAALERLYRSQTWDDMSFALAAFPYWRAWIDLQIAKRIDDEGLKTQALLPAQKGFRAASMQLFRPGLVYGGWLGMGYVELEEGRSARAMEIFQNLDNALASEPDSPVRQAVQIELRLLEARTGQVKTTRKSDRVDEIEARILRVEAFALLQDSRKTGGRPWEAAVRLKKIIEAGYLDQSLVNDMMIYAQELSGVDIGIYTDLAGGEFALQYEHYYNAMQKFQSFFSNVIAPPGIDFTRYRYRWALAAYKAEIYQPAVDILEKMQRKKGLDPELDKATAKLLYAVYAAREQTSGSVANRKLLRTAAQRFVRKSPGDADADAARLMIAQTSSSASTALKSLKSIKSTKKLNGDVERTAYQIIARDFSRKIARGKTNSAKGLARDGISAFSKLPKADKADPFNFAILLQMRALIDPKPEEVLKAIEFIETKGNTNLDIRRALIWSRLQLYDRSGDMSKVRDFVRSLASNGIPSWQMEFLYPFVAERKSVGERIELARLLHPSSKDQPEMDRRFRALIIEDLLTQGESQEAYGESLVFSKEHPSSGDAWRLLAKSAEANEQPFEADRAWRVITDKAIPTMTIWWEGMFSRVRIRTNSTRPYEACPLIDEIVRSEEHMPANLKGDFEVISAAAGCPTKSAALAD